MEEQLDLDLPIAASQKKRDMWDERIRTYDQSFDKWKKSAEKIIARFRDERASGDDALRARRYNMLWSNVETLGPAIYAKQPKVEVNRRYADRDLLGRISSAVLERAVSYENDITSLHPAMLNCRSDYLLVGRATLWQRYEPIIEEAAQDPESDDEVADDLPGNGGVTGEGPFNPQGRVLGENAPTDYVHWKDFLHGPAQTWDQVPWVGRIVLMDKASVDKRWPAKPGEDPMSKRLSFTHKQHKDDEKNQRTVVKGTLAKIYELWDKASFKVAWFSPDLKDSLIEEVDDPLELEDFFPCCKPLYATMTTDRLEPVPDYILYQDQAAELDSLTQRIGLLIKAIAVRGAYDRSNKDLADLLNERPENFMIPVDNWAAFAEKGGLQGTMSFVPIDQVIKVVQALQAARSVIIQDIYQITGIADIIRGAGDPNETATAQKIKGNFANLRLNSRRDEVTRFLRDSIRIKSEVIAKQFDQSTLRKISGYDQMTEIVSAQKEGQDINQLWAQVYGMIQDDPLRLTHLTVETDSMIESDQQEEQASRVQFLEAVGQFLEKAVAAYQTMPAMGPLMAQMLAFGIRGFRIGRELEGIIDTAMDQLQQAASQPKPPSPDVIKAQTEAQHVQAEDNIAMAKQDLAKWQAQENIKLAREELMLKYGINPFIEAALAAHDKDQTGATN